MAKSFNYYCFVVCLFSILWADRSFGYNVRDSLTQVIESQIGVKEEGGNNRGEQVEKYLSSVGLSGGYAWCAAFVKWCFLQVGVYTNSNAWSPSWFPDSKVIYHRNKTWGVSAMPGDVFGLYYNRLKRIGHVGFIYKVTSKYFITVEGNTNAGGSREGDGVLKRYRPHWSIYKISSWVK